MRANDPEICRRWASDNFSYDPSTGVITHSFSRASVKAGQVAGSAEKNGYTRIKVRGTKILAHRFAWFLHYGRWPENQLDHINRDRSDNRLLNLREVSAEGNAHNKGVRKNNQSGVSGVRWRPHLSKWQATISRRGRRISLGHFAKIEEAELARREAERDWAVMVSSGEKA